MANVLDEQRDDRPAYVRFERIAIEDVQATLAAGHYVAKDVDMALITPPYSKDVMKYKVKAWFDILEQDVRNNRMPQAWLDRYKEAYAAFQKGQDLPLTGSPIKGWGIISPAQQETLIKMSVLTVEDLAAMNDEGIKRIGMGAIDLKNKAKAWLSQLNDTGALALQMAELQKQFANLEAVNKTQEEKIETMKRELAFHNAQSATGELENVVPISGISASDVLDDDEDEIKVARKKGQKMTLLEVVQQFCLRSGIPSPSTVTGSTDTQVLQVQALLEEEGADLSARGDWESLTNEATHTTIAAESQGAIATIASNGFRHIKNQTIWDRTDRLPIIGPINQRQWQALKAVVMTGPRYQFRIRGGLLMVNPEPVAGHDWAFEYISKNWIISEDGMTYKRLFTADTDEFLLPDELLLMGLRWRWMREKGLDYSELFATYEAQVKDAIGRDAGKPVLKMDDTHLIAEHGTFVPSGSWNVT